MTDFIPVLRDLYIFLSGERRRHLFRVIILMFAGAVAELATIGAVLPFLGFLVSPNRIQNMPFIADAMNVLGAVTMRQRVMTATAGFVLVAIIGALIRLQLTWSSRSFVFNLGHDLAVEIQRRLLLQPYAFHVNNNSSSLISTLEKTDIVIYNIFEQFMQIAIAFAFAVFIIFALIVITPTAALIAVAGFSFLYILVFLATRGRLASNSEIVASSVDKRIKIVQESLGGIRDVIIDGSQSVYLDEFRRIDDRFKVAKTHTAFIGAAPRFIIEAIGMVLIAVLAVAISQREGGFAAALPILGALALGAQRLLPLLQQMYVSWSLAAGNESTFVQVMDLLKLPLQYELASPGTGLRLLFEKKINFQDVSFAYPGRKGLAIDRISLEIPHGARVALIGTTGSGKSTFADLLMGLIDPTNGRISVDGITLGRENCRDWQRSIAHVSQAIFLADTSIARNIALGAPAQAVDLQRVRDAARKAQLEEFISGLPRGYDTQVGERGIRLSGGQRQRLGIARAIYKEAPVLVLDEATSALDDATEAAVIQPLDRLGEEGRTIIIIAHRPSTVAWCDIVVRLENGHLAEVGTYAEVIGRTRRAAFNS